MRGRVLVLVAALAPVAAAGLLLSTPAAQRTAIKGAVGGFPNVPQTPGDLLSGLNAPNQGRTAILAYHGDLLFTVPEVPASQGGSDFQVRTWDISDPTAPAELATWGITPMPINAHGYLSSGPYLVLGANWPPGGEWTFRADGPGTVTRTPFPDDPFCAGVRGCLFSPWFVRETWWSYGAIEGTARLSRGNTDFAEWDHLGLTGVIGHPFLLGDLLIFASDDSRSGVATYDVSNPDSPVLLDVLTTGGPGGYWPELWGGDGKLYVVFPYRENGNGFRVVDVTDPTDVRFVTDRPLPGDEAMYAQFQDHHAFIGSHKVDLRTFESVVFFDGPANDVDTSQFALPLGNLLVTGGVGQHQGMAIWAHQAAPDTAGPTVGFHVPRAGRTNYPTGAPISLLIHETLDTTTIVNGTTFIVRPLGGSAIDGRLTFSFDDVLTFTPDQPLQANTTYEVVLPADGIEDAAGNGIEETYTFTFSTGNVLGGNPPPVITDFDATPYPAAPGAQVSFDADAFDPGGGALEYRFDFGDGSPSDPWGPADTATHAYADPGHYRAVVQVRNTAGTLVSDLETVTVLVPPAGPSPTRSSPIACDAAARRVWNVNPDNDTVAAVHADTLAEELEVAVCDDPRSIARAATGELWVTCHDDDRVRVLASNGAPLASIATGYGTAPAGLAFAPAGDTAYVALEGSGELARFDAATRTLTGRIPLGPTPRAVAVSGDGSRILVTRFLSPRHHAEVWDVAAAPFILTRTLRIPKFGGEENRDTTASGRGVANYLTGIAIDPDGESAWVASTKPNTERGVLFGPDLDTDNTMRTVVSQIDLVGNTFLRAIDIDDSDSANTLAFSPLGDYLLVTLQGNNELVVLDNLLIGEVAGLGSLVTRIGTGLAPQGLCLDPTTNRTFVQDFMSRTVSALDTDALFRHGDLGTARTAISTVAVEALPQQVLLGKQIFYNARDTRMSAEGYLSCASCHLDGGHDGRTWDFTGRGEGLRNTVTLRGRAGMGQGNVHWTANFDEIQDFENDIRLAFGGAGFLSDPDFAATQNPLGAPKAGLSPDLDALAAYVASLAGQSLPRSPYRNPDGTVSAQALTGRGVFATAGCDSCHTGPQRTDSEVGPGNLHDVGTLRTTSGERLGGPLTGIDTPTLLGLWNTGPYLHDGSAPALQDVFTVAGGTVLPAETATPAPPEGAWITNTFVELNNDDTVHGRAYGFLQDTGATLTFTGVDGGSGGVGALEVRYSSQARTLQVSVNGGPPAPLPLAAMGNSPDWRHTNWGVARLEGVTFAAGAANTLVLSSSNDFPNISIDEVVITTADDLTTAQPHRQVLALSAADRNALLLYLAQLDGTTFSGAPEAADFHTVVPCRLLDTRQPEGTHGGPRLLGGTSRVFPLAGRCDIPATARAVSVNLTVTQATAAGHLELYPAGPAPPPTSTINYQPGTTRANNAIVRLNDLGELAVRCGQGSGTAHAILDVNGYFE
jgi:DNA-binding beta-propeller fold protein YncE